MPSARGVRAGRAYVEVSLLDRLDAGFLRAEAKAQRFAASLRRVSARLFGGGAALSAPLLAFTNAAGDAQESLSKFGAVFGDLTDDATAFAETLGDDVGRNVIELQDGLATFQSFFKGLEFDNAKAFGMSKQLQQLALDFASFYNISDDEGLGRFISALSGSSEVLDRFGINIKAAALDQEFLRQGLKVNTRTATEQQKVMARLAIIMRSMGQQGAIGDAVRTADSYNNQNKRLMGILSRLSTTIGGKLIPMLRPLITRFSDVASRVTDLIDQNPQLVQGLALAAAGFTATGAAALTMSAGVSLAGFAFGGFGRVAGLVAKLTLPFSMASRAALGLVGTVTGLTGVLGKVRIPRAFVAFSRLLRSLPVLALSVGKQIGGGMLLAASGMATLGRITFGTAGAIAGVLLNAVSRLTIAFATNVTQLGLFGANLAKASLIVTKTSLARFGTAADAALSALVGSMSAATGGLLRVGTLTAMAGQSLFTLGHRALFASKALTKLSLKSLTTGLLAAGKALKTGILSGGFVLLKGLLLGLTSPTFLFTAAIVGAGYALYQAFGGIEGIIGGFRGLFDYGQSVFSGLASSASQAWNGISAVASQSFGAIVSRVKAGDLQGAWNIALAAMKAAWSEVVLAFAPQWTAFTTTFQDGWKASTSLFGDLWRGAKSMFSGVTDSLSGTWASLVRFIGGNTGSDFVIEDWTDLQFKLAGVLANVTSNFDSLWESIKNGVRNAFDFVGDAASKGMRKLLEAQLSIADLLGQDTTLIEAEIQRIDREMSDRDDRRQQRNEESADRQAQIERDRIQTQQTLEEDRQRRKQQKQQEIDDAVAEAQRKRDSARQALDEAISAEPAEETEQQTDELSKQWDATKKLQNSMQHLIELKQTSATAAVSGSGFDIAALSRLTGIDPQVLRDLHGGKDTALKLAERSSSSAGTFSAQVASQTSYAPQTQMERVENELQTMNQTLNQIEANTDVEAH